MSLTTFQDSGKTIQNDVPANRQNPANTTLRAAHRAAQREGVAMVVGCTYTSFYIKTEAEMDRYDQGIRYRVNPDGSIDLAKAA